MKVILVMDSISRDGGGLLDAERCLHQGLDKLGVQTAVFALDDPFAMEDFPQWKPLNPKVFPHNGLAAIGSSLALRDAIHGESADLIYRAGLWRMPSKYAHEWSRKQCKPEIIAPHGMLDPWAVRNSRWKKRLAHWWFEGAHLRDATCIRALCESEAQSVRTYGLKNPVCIVPNGIKLPDLIDLRTPSSELRTLLFLGRIHPKKGLPNALRAWAKIRKQETGDRKQEKWQFVIAGWDQGGHEAVLKRLCDELHLAYAELAVTEFLKLTPASCPLNTVVFVGPAFGYEKDALLRKASAFILPSFSEGLPMSVLEAWSYRVPVLMTDHCNIPEGFAADAAIRIGTDVESIAAGMTDFFRSPISELESLGANGRTLVEHQFTWNQVAAQMKQVYEWILGGRDKPECVRE